MTAPLHAFQTDEAYARELDDADSLAPYRERFHLPRAPGGTRQAYLCGNSLGLQPRAAANLVRDELETWARLGVDGHFHGPRPWYSYHQLMRESGAELVGARAGEVVMMNSLTANLHLMMVSFYEPTKDRYKILTDGPLFPSDRFALRSQAEFHGLEPSDTLIEIVDDGGAIDEARFEEVLDREGERIALVLLSGVNYHTGQFLDIPRIARSARSHACVVGLDLAHAVGNVPLALHDWDIDFAVWCSYKYLNAGPGAVGGCFVHEKHAHAGRGRFAGWWGGDPTHRFEMEESSAFVPQPGAEGWQLSNPPVLAMAPLHVSLEIFSEAGMGTLREKSRSLTGYMESLLGSLGLERFAILTPTNPEARGCQLSIHLGPDAKRVVSRLGEQGIVVDFRPPGVVRAAPVPLYNMFHDVWRFAKGLADAVS